MRGVNGQAVLVVGGSAVYDASSHVTTTTMRQVSEDASLALSRLPDFSFVVCFSL
jgi:hypothetical protein